MAHFFKKLQDSFAKTSSATWLILINGLLVAAIVLIVLRSATVDLTFEEARRATRDVMRGVEQSLEETEKSIKTLGYFYSSVGGSGQAAAGISKNIRQLLVDNVEIDGVLFASDKGLWHQEDFLNRKEKNAYDPAAGWPDYVSLNKTMIKFKAGEIGYLQPLPWPAFEKKQTVSPADIPAGLVMKVAHTDGSQGILLVVTTPAHIFGNDLVKGRDDIASVMIQDRDSGFTVVESGQALIPAADASSDIERVSYVLQLGNQYWDIHFGVKISPLAIMMNYAPWTAFGIVFFLTAVAAGLTERKHRQDMIIAQMSRHLEGTQSELLTKTSERDHLFYTLRKSERESRAMINSVSEVIFETDENGRLMFLNEPWKKMTLRSIDETLGQSLFFLLDPADQSRQREMFEELVRGERQAYRTETRLNIDKNIFKPVEIAFSMLRMTEDKSLRVVGTITDTEQRHRAELAVREAEQKFRTIFENSVSGIYQSSPAGRYISANRAMAEILGYASPEDLISTVENIGQEIYVYPDQYRALVQKLLFEGRVSGFEAEVYKKNGQKIWIMENMRIVRSDKGAVDYYEGSIWDVTERKKAEEAMRHAHLQAELASRTRMEFLANMSHELRTPLNAIIGFSEIIKDESMGPVGLPSYKDYAKDIFESGNHLLRIISDILEVSKIATGTRELNIGNFKLPRVLKSCLTILGSRIEQAGVHVTMDLSEDLPEILGEELAFKQIMINLVSNAIKFTPKGGSVSVRASVSGDSGMVIDVIDTGCGMSPEEIKKAMQPFAKIDMSFTASKSGTGLGLTIVDSLITLHGGKFEIISEKGKGTTARVTLPPSCLYHPNTVTAIGKLKVVK